MGGSRSTIKSVVDAVISRHRAAWLPSPLDSHMEYTRFTRCISRLLGTQLQHKFPITRDMVVRALRWRPSNITAFRNKMTLITSTAGCSRPSETAASQSCNWGFDTDAAEEFPKSGWFSSRYMDSEPVRSILESEKTRLEEVLTCFDDL